MEQLINYLLQFGHLNEQQMDFIRMHTKEIELEKDEYFSEAGKIPHQVGFILEGVIRGCYYNKAGEEITRCFVTENSIVVDYINFENNNASSESLQASTFCKLLVFSKKDWNAMSHSVAGWDNIKNKVIQNCLFYKSRKSPVISQDATTRYLEFMKNYPSLTNRVPLAYVANYLGITQQSLSRIRRNIR